MINVPVSLAAMSHFSVFNPLEVHPQCILLSFVHRNGTLDGTFSFSMPGKHPNVILSHCHHWKYNLRGILFDLLERNPTVL